MAQKKMVEKSKTEVARVISGDELLENAMKNPGVKDVVEICRLWRETERVLDTAGGTSLGVVVNSASTRSSD